MGEAAKCPTCGQVIAQVPMDETLRLLDLLTLGEPHREVYKGTDGNWYVTYGGGIFSEAAVFKLVRSGKIHSCYSDCPDEAYHVGRTIDVGATKSERRKHKKKRDAPIVYVDSPPSPTEEGK